MARKFKFFVRQMASEIYIFVRQMALTLQDQLQPEWPRLAQVTSLLNLSGEPKNIFYLF